MQIYYLGDFVVRDIIKIAMYLESPRKINSDFVLSTFF